MAALLVMLNNYLHDLATAVFAVSALAAYLLGRQLRDELAGPRVAAVLGGLVTTGYVSLVWVIAAGGIRAWAYRQYEWVGAAGRDQVVMLVVKHVILLAFTIVGVVALLKGRAQLGALRRTGAQDKQEA